MLHLSKSEYQLLTQNDTASILPKLQNQIQQLTTQVDPILMQIEKLQEEVRQIEQKIKDITIEHRKHQADLRHIQTTFIKSRGFDPGKLSFTINPTDEGGEIIFKL
jgi:peptidoglycan hydrolase CwlO-like protein